MECRQGLSWTIKTNATTGRETPPPLVVSLSRSQWDTKNGEIVSLFEKIMFMQVFYRIKMLLFYKNI
jgi:hypothetical protein